MEDYTDVVIIAKLQMQREYKIFDSKVLKLGIFHRCI